MLRRTESRSAAVSWPATRAVPDVALASMQRILMVVVLAAPFGPRKPNVSPLVTSKSIPRTASTSPYRLVRPETDITASGLRPFSPGSPPASRRVTAGLAALSPGCIATAAASLELSPSRLTVVGAVLRAGAAVGAILVIGGKYPVQGLARVRENLAGLPDLAVGAGAQHLEGGHAHLPDQAAHLDRGISDGSGHRVPRGADLVRVSLDVVAALAGELVAPPAALVGLGHDQPLVLQLLQRRVDGSRAGPPHAVAPLADLLDDLVAVHRPLGQQGQRRGTHVAALGPGSAPHPRLAHPPAGGEMRAAGEAGPPGKPGKPGTTADVAAPTAAAPPGEVLIAAAPPALFVAAAPPVLLFSHCLLLRVGCRDWLVSGMPGTVVGSS